MLSAPPLRFIAYSIALTVVAAASCPARAELIDIAWNSSGQFEKTATVPPGKFLELCGGLSSGQTIGWSFDADQALDFNIHFHEGKAVVFPAKYEGAKQAAGTLNVVAKQDYCWMWSNKNTTAVKLTARLKR
ncbi:MAG: hypothetical protein ABIZ64_04510 [Casimicrobium sp.]|jgi:hypothetical protein